MTKPSPGKRDASSDISDKSMIKVAAAIVGAILVMWLLSKEFGTLPELAVLCVGAYVFWAVRRIYKDLTRDYKKDPWTYKDSLRAAAVAGYWTNQAIRKAEHSPHSNLLSLFGAGVAADRTFEFYNQRHNVPRDTIPGTPEYQARWRAEHPTVRDRIAMEAKAKAEADREAFKASEAERKRRWMESPEGQAKMVELEARRILAQSNRRKA